jgi:hypothetical protein
MKKFLLWFMAFIVLGIAGFFVAGSYLKKNWKPLLESQLKQAVINSSDSLYRIEYKNLDVNPINGNLKLVEFKLIPVMEVYEKLKSEKKAPDNIYQLEVDALIIRNANAKEAVSTKKLNVKDIIIDHPKLIITNNRQAYNDTVTVARKKKTPYELIKDIFSELKINTIALKDVDFTFINESNKPSKQTSLRNLDITITDLLIDSLSSQDSSRVYYTKNVALNIKNYQIATPDSLYFVKVDDLNFSTNKNLLSLKNVRLEPRLSKVAFHKKTGIAKDRFDLSFNDILIKDMDFDLFLKQQKLYARSLAINNAKVDVYNNNAYKKIKKDKTGKFPHQQLLKLALDMKIAKVNLKNVDISYSEYDRKSGRTGKIQFKNTNGSIKNVANDAKSLANNAVMSADLDTRIFGKAHLKLNMNFYMSSKIGAFDYSGTIGSFDGRIINQIVTPLGMAEINSVNVQKLIFNIKANQNIARGTVKFYYTDLNVNVLKREENGNLKKQGLISTITNKFIIEKQNPNKKDEFTIGRVLYTRPYYAGFFNYLWQSLFTGLKESVGVSREKESKLKKNAADIGQAVNEVKETIQNIKENLKEKKEKRQERREEKKLEKLKEEEEQKSDSTKVK